MKAERTGRGGGHWKPKSDRNYFVPHLPSEDLIPALQCRVPALGVLAGTAGELRPETPNGDAGLWDRVGE